MKQPEKTPIREGPDVWESPYQCAHVINVVKANPRREKDLLDYIHRIAVTAGLIAPTASAKDREPGQDG